MSNRWTHRKRKAASRAFLALIGATGCLVGAAFAATRQAAAPVPKTVVASTNSSTDLSPNTGLGGKRPLKPRITRHPAAMTASTVATFRFVDRDRRLRFQCRLDRHRWQVCSRRVAYRHLAIGVHRFKVRARDGAGKLSPAARFKWSVARSESFSVTPQPSTLGALYPGAAPVAIPVLLTNSNSFPIYVTKLGAKATSSPPGCDSATNIALSPSSASSSTAVRIAAHSSASLPSQGISAPMIQLRDLPVNQDACQGGQFPLSFYGSAHG